MRMNLGRITCSLNLNSQIFPVYRSSGEFDEGGWVEIVPSPVSFNMRGIITPASERELEQVPEGDRTKAAISILTKDPLFVTRIGEYEGTSDQVEWQGERYRVFNSNPFGDYGFYTTLAIRMSGN